MAEQNRDGGTTGTGDREAAADRTGRQGGGDGLGGPDAGSPGGMGGAGVEGATGGKGPPAESARFRAGRTRNWANSRHRRAWAPGRFLVRTKITKARRGCGGVSASTVPTDWNEMRCARAAPASLCLRDLCANNFPPPPGMVKAA